MMYSMFQAQSDLLGVARLLASPAAGWLGQPWAERDGAYGARKLAAAMHLFTRATTTHRRPDFGIDRVQAGDSWVQVREHVALRLPFADLLHFEKDQAQEQPRVLVVAPLSGHFATLLRGTVQTLLADHDVYITDWRNVRDVSLSEGVFDLDGFVTHCIECIEHLGRGCHVVAVCQPTVGVLAAVSVMAQARNPAQPATMTLMAGPLDTRLNPTKVNDLAKSKPIEWFERNLISPVPLGFLGAGRKVYPGFVQLTAFMAMNLDRHVKAHLGYYENLVLGEGEKTAAHERFYDEYFAVMDLDAAFYIETVRHVFQEHALPLGRLQYQGRLVEPQAIRRTALFTVEGELDDICSIGQTMAALDLCSGIAPFMKRHHLQSGVGHYGVFNGRRWAGEIYPQVREFIQAYETRSHLG
jgi:poly(3-hydroxybutyrate) depolymerase